MIESGIDENLAWAKVQKHSGDDPDITDKAFILAHVSLSSIPGIAFHAGKGVGTVTRAGLQIAPGNAAINPVPRRMIADHLLALAPGWNVTISVENGEILAERTFNPRLGIVGGISIIGTTGIVRPFSHESQLCSIRCEIGVARAANLTRLILVPGHYGERFARMHYRFSQDPGVIEIGNDWGFAMDLLQQEPMHQLLIVGHPGKLAKIAMNQWDTHSSRSNSALPWIMEEWKNFSGSVANPSNTVEGFYQATCNRPESPLFWICIAEQIASSLRSRASQSKVAVSLCDMEGNGIAESSGVIEWK